MKNKKRYIVVIFSIVLLTVALFSFEQTRLSLWSNVQPVARYLLRQNQTVYQYWQSLRSINHLATENNQLRRQNTELLAQKINIDDLTYQNQILSELVDFKNSADLQIKAAHIIGRSSLGTVSSLVIDQGSADGIKRGQAVISDRFLIGIVTGISEHSAEVELINSNSVKVNVMLQDAMANGVLQGGNRGILVENIAKNVTIRVGENIVTSALIPELRRGIAVGTVDSIVSLDTEIYQSVSVKTPIDFNRLDIVAVVL